MDTNNGGKNRNVYRTVKEENLFSFFKYFFPLPTVRIYQVELLDTSLHNVSVT